MCSLSAPWSVLENRPERISERTYSADFRIRLEIRFQRNGKRSILFVLNESSAYFLQERGRFIGLLELSKSKKIPVFRSPVAASCPPPKCSSLVDTQKFLEPSHRFSKTGKTVQRIEAHLNRSRRNHRFTVARVLKVLGRNSYDLFYAILRPH